LFLMDMVTDTSWTAAGPCTTATLT
jgi:hypothetical protein